MSKNNTKGYTLVELMVVLAIMGILGTMLVTMMNTGGRLYRDANATMEAQSNARLAISYINMRIRQNDVSNKIKFDTATPFISINDSSDTDYTFWIYFDSSSGKLREQRNTNTVFDGSALGSVTDIADISKFEVNPTETTDRFSIEVRGKSEDGKVETDLTQDLTLRTDN